MAKQQGLNGTEVLVLEVEKAGEQYTLTLDLPKLAWMFRNARENKSRACREAYGALVVRAKDVR